jgi:hypothetical protein
MPTHVYHPSRTPANWLDRILVHPFDNGVAVLTTIFGVTMAAALVTYGFNPSTSMMRLPVWVATAVTFGCVAGGPLALLGLHWTGETVSKGWAIERLGWLLVVGGLGGYAIAVAWNFPGSLYSWLVPAILAACGLLRFVSLVLIERNTRRTLSVVREEQRESE